MVSGLSVVWHQNHRDDFLQFGVKTGGDGFLWFGLKTGGNGFFWFGLKIGGRFHGCASKPRWWRVSQFGPQNRQLWFGDLGLKNTAMVSWFGPQNQAGYGLSVAPQNQWKGDDVEHASRSSGLLRVEANPTWVF
jgi:hypothetical protein